MYIHILCVSCIETCTGKWPKFQKSIIFNYNILKVFNHIAGRVVYFFSFMPIITLDAKKKAEALNLKGKKLDYYLEQTYECAMKNRTKLSSENLQNQFLKDSITICRCNNLFFEFDDQRELIMFDGSELRQLNYEDSLNIHILKNEELRINILCHEFESQYDKSFLEIERSKCDSIVFD